MNTQPPHTIPAPDDGPRILFFSGGTALRDLSRRLVRLTRASAHVITPFDSGGSSAVLRRAFGMPAPGDLRNRLMALADRSHKGHPEVFELFAHRFPKVAHPGGLDAELAEMAGGAHPLVSVVPEPMRSAVREHLEVFMQMMPVDFDLRGASIGNLILTAGYLAADRNFSVVLDTFRILARVLGEVALSCEADLHLAAELADGTVVCGQHRLTGKETAPLASAPVRLWACQGEDDPTPAPCAASAKALELVAGAELICFPMGSLFTSVAANLLPEGMGRAVAANPCPKVFIPNLGHDPECPGMAVADQAKIVVEALRKDMRADGGACGEAPLDMVLADAARGGYPGGLDEKALRALGARLVDRPLVTERSAPLLDAEPLARELAAMARRGRA